MITEQDRNELLAPRLSGQGFGRQTLMTRSETYQVKRWWDLSEKRVKQGRERHISIGSSWLDQKPWYYIPHADWTYKQLVIGTKHFHHRLLGHFTDRVGIDKESGTALTDFVNGLDGGRQVLQWHTSEWPILSEKGSIVLGGYTERLSAGKPDNELDRWINWYLANREDK